MSAAAPGPGDTVLVRMTVVGVYPHQSVMLVRPVSQPKAAALLVQLADVTPDLTPPAPAQTAPASD